jgi:flagellar biosynthesis chaperone FliJ
MGKSEGREQGLTVKELSKLYWLKREIDQNTRKLEKLQQVLAEDEERLRTLQDNADGLHGMNMDGMPHGSSVGSAVENTALRIMQLEEDVKQRREEVLNLQALISARQTLAVLERARLEKYIGEIDDPRMRLAFTCRFESGQSWEDVAQSMGGKCEADTVKKMCYRYIRNH